MEKEHWRPNSFEICETVFTWICIKSAFFKVLSKGQSKFVTEKKGKKWMSLVC